MTELLDDLSDSELKQRLIHRGVSPEDVLLAVSQRDHPFVRRSILNMLGEEAD